MAKNLIDYHNLIDFKNLANYISFIIQKTFIELMIGFVVEAFAIYINVIEKVAF